MNTTRSRSRRLLDRLVGRGSISVPTPATRVLVVDDDAVIRALIAVTLSVEGFEVVEAVDGPEALETLRLIGPDIVTLDAEMPPMSGWEVAQQLHADPQTAGIKVLLLSAHDAHRDPRYYKPLGVDACLRKPFDAHELVAVVKELAG